MSDSISASKALESAAKEMKQKDCKKGKEHKWVGQTPYYGMSQCQICKKTVYTK